MESKEIFGTLMVCATFRSLFRGGENLLIVVVDKIYKSLQMHIIRTELSVRMNQVFNQVFFL